MKIEISVDDRSDFDYALNQAVEEYKMTENKDGTDNYEVWGCDFKLISVNINDNYKRKNYTYIFEVE